MPDRIPTLRPPTARAPDFAREWWPRRWSANRGLPQRSPLVWIGVPGWRLQQGQTSWM